MADMLGKYEIVSELGRGGMGVVYKGRDPETSEDVAIKVLPAQMAMDPVFRQRFIREVRTLQRLEHPNIVRIYDSGHHEGSLWYAMEFVEGTDLERELKEHKRLNPLRAVSILLEATKALAYSHTQRVIHRDIKPANIMLATNGAVKLADFGIARVTDATRMTATAGVLGTVEYMSPEQASGVVVDERTDVYSLGVVFYISVTGRLPITGKNPSEMLMRIRTQQVDPPSNWIPDLPRNVNELIVQMLEKDRAKRIMSAQALQRELERIQKQLTDPTSAEDLASSLPAPKEVEAIPLGRMLPLVAMVFAAGLGVGYLLFRGETKLASYEAVMGTAKSHAGRREFATARERLSALLARTDLTPEQRGAADALHRESRRGELRNVVASRVWVAMDRAGRAGLVLVEDALRRILAEQLPDTNRGGQAAKRLNRRPTRRILRRRLSPRPPEKQPAAKPKADTKGK